MNAVATIAARAAEQGLPFLVAGGHAVMAHGHPRSTFDLDLMVRHSDREGWSRLAAALGYVLHRESPAFLQYNPATPEALPLDLILVNDDTFTKLATEAVPAPAGGGSARIVSLLHLLALKCHAIKHGDATRIVKDADDVIRLLQHNRLDVNEPGLRALFLQHGTTEFYEKVRRLCAPG